MKAKFKRPKTPLRYCGSKGPVSDLLRQFRPLPVWEFRDPMVGGGSMFFELAYLFQRVWINDMHRPLMEFYEALRDRPDEFIQMVRAILPAQPGEPLTEAGPRGGAPKHARLKAVFDSVRLNEECDQAFRFFVCNRMGFHSGRVNFEIANRQMFGSHTGWNMTATDRLELASAALQGVKLSCGDYRPLLTAPGENVWVFIDPPYVMNSFLDRSSQLYEHSFTEQDHYELAATIKNCEHTIALTYDDHELVRSLYPESDYQIVELEWTYSGTTLDKKEAGRELLIMNYTPPV